MIKESFIFPSQIINNLPITKTINLHFTDFCNFHCHHCFIKKDGKELSYDSIKRIIDNIYDYSINSDIKFRINLAGGEPLVSPNIQLIIDYIYSRGIEVSIITNGMFLTEEFISKNKSKLSMIGISVDTLDVNTNLKIGRCNNNQTLDINYLIDICNIIKNNNIKLKINICLSKYNINENLTNFLKEINPNRVKFLRVLVDHNQELYNQLAITDEQWNQAKKTYNNVNNVFFEDNDYMRNSYLIIDSEGNLSCNNYHLNNNSLLEKTFEECIEHLHNMEVE